MPFTAASLIDTLVRLTQDAAGYCIAYSGGVDSHVLLHALATQRSQLRVPLHAVHVNHNLQAQATAWARHCARQCAQLDVPFESLTINAHAAPGESPEAAARQARYRALADWLPAGHVLLAAHHQDDQAETVLLQLLRGAGPKGLAAMPAVTALGRGRLLRPLLEVTRAELLAYAEQQGLQWIEDPSNAQQGFDRNYLRHSIMPLLRARWPASAAVLARSAAHQAEAAQLLDELARLDLKDLKGADPDSAVVDLKGAKSGSVPGFPLLSAPRRANLLRYWLHSQGAPLPSTAILQRLEQDVLNAAPDAEPVLRWGHVTLRRYRDQLYLFNGADMPEPDPAMCIDWDGQRQLAIAGGVLSSAAVLGAGVAATHLTGAAMQVRLRRGGEQLQPAGRREQHSLKHLFQDAGVPPWERGRVPLIYQNERLIAVAGYWVCEGFQAGVQQPGVQFKWSRAIVPAGSFW